MIQIYSHEFSYRSAPKITPEYKFIYAIRPRHINDLWALWNWQAPKYALKVLSGKRVFFGMARERALVSSGWANIGFCSDFPIGRKEVVLGNLWTHPDHRCKGLATAAICRIVNVMIDQGYTKFWIAASPANLASQRMIAKAGFTVPEHQPLGKCRMGG